jgi:hypothetical protein
VFPMSRSLPRDFADQQRCLIENPQLTVLLVALKTQPRIRIELPMRKRRIPILSRVRRRPENREGRATLFAHLTAMLGGVSGRGEEKGSSLKRSLCNILERADVEKIWGLEEV